MAGEYRPIFRAVPSALAPVPSDGRILLLRQGGIGDALVCVPVVRALRRHRPAARLDLLLGRRNAAAAAPYRPYVDTILTWDQRPAAAVRVLAALRRARYDAAVDLIDTPSTTSRLLLRAAGAPVRVGIAHAAPAPYTHPVPALDFPGMHIVERVAQVLVAFGIDPMAEPLELEYPVSPAEAAEAEAVLGGRRGRPRVGVNLAGSSPAKYWGRANVAAFVRGLRAAHPAAEVLLFGPADYAAEAEAIAAEVGEPAVVRAAPVARSFHAFACRLHACDVIVTPDTSVSHLAAAWQRPSLVLFIQTGHQATLWRPWRSPHRVLWHPRAVREIPVAAALAAFADLVAPAGHPEAACR